ncbi:hypothetical protein KCP78_17850 [Salmonella enterica subsp. enterica]|nr:hypothetical protein KCP78_17850 [Salmonella enterica subsp. enterica]
MARTMAEGIGPVMLVLIGVAPAGFVVNMNASSRLEITQYARCCQQSRNVL